MSEQRRSARALDRSGVHDLLWLDSHPKRHTVRISQTEYAALLRVGQPTFSRTLAALVIEGRITRIGDGTRFATYRVTDPKEWGEDGVRRPLEEP